MLNDKKAGAGCTSRAFKHPGHDVTAPDVWPSILTDYTYDSELDNADGVPHSVSTQLDVPGGEQEICNMVIANNSIRLREIQSAIINDNNVFANINSVSISTIDRVLKRHQMTMKQLYKVPFERNSERVKELRYQYVQVN